MCLPDSTVLWDSFSRTQGLKEESAGMLGYLPLRFAQESFPLLYRQPFKARKCSRRQEAFW